MNNDRIQEHECFDEFMYPDEVVYDTYSTLKGLGN